MIANLTKILKGIGRSIHLLIELIFLLLILVAFGIRTSWFQTYLAQNLAKYLSGELNTEISIDKVDIVFLDIVDIEGVYLEDLKKDTLLYTEQLHINIGALDFNNSIVEIENVGLKNANVELKTYKGDTTFNFQYLVDYFASSEVDTTAASPFKIEVKQLDLENINFQMQDQNADALTFGLDYSNLGIRNLSGQFSNFSFSGDSIHASIQNLQFKERSGLVLKNLSTDLLYSPRLISLEKLRLAFGNSTLIADVFELKTPNGSADFSNFVHKVEFNGNIRNTKISLQDISYFVPSLEGMSDLIRLNSTDISGPVYGMKLKNTDIQILDTTRLMGDFQIPDLDHGEHSFFVEKIDLFRTSIADIEKLKLSPFLDGEDYLEIPANLRIANVIVLKNGHFTGSPVDFVVDGNLYSGLGNVFSEYGIQIRTDTSGMLFYNGARDNKDRRDIILENVNLSAISGNDLMGNTSGYLSINKGSKGTAAKNLNVDFFGEFQTIHLNDYDYQNIIIKEGLFAKNRFTGKINVKDDNLALDYKGYIDLNKDMYFGFVIEIDSASFTETNVLRDSLIDRFASKIKVEINGTSINKMYGTVEIDSLNYKKGDIDFSLEQLELSIVRNEISDSIKVRSEILDLDLFGKFDLLNIWPIIQHQFSQVANNLIEDTELTKIENEFFDLRIQLKNINPLMQFVPQDIYVAQNSEITSSFNGTNETLNLNINSDSVIFEGNKLIGIHLSNYFDSLRANVQYEIDLVKLSDSLQVKNAHLYSNIKDNVLLTNFGWDGSGSIEPALFAFKTSLLENKDIFTEFKPSFFFLQDSKWDIDPNSTLLWNPDLIELNNVSILNGEHTVKVDGKVSKDPKDWLYFQVNEFDLNDLNGLLDGAMTLGGTLNIEGGVSDVYNNIKFMAVSQIGDLVINKEEVGDVLIDSKWDKLSNSIGVHGYLKRDRKETFRFKGDYFTEKEKDNIDLTLLFDYTDIGFLNAFSDPELYTDIEGILNGELKVTGELVNPIINGHLEVVSANVMVPMFNVPFGIAGDVRFGEGEILVDKMTVYDQEGNDARAQMQIYHYDWMDWNYDITLDMESSKNSKKFMVMNTKYKEGDFYYGKAYITGLVNIFGYDGITEIGVNATTKPGTDLKLAMYGSGDLTESSFIIYDTIVPKSFGVDSLNDKTKIESTGLVLDMNFNVTRDAKVSIIFDPVYEDQIVVNSGEGEIGLKMDQYGEMKMFGKYTIIDGKYYMRMKNIVNKDFTIRNGSNVSWTQSPYDAIIDINADFERQVSLDDIMASDIEEGTGKKETVIGTLHMGDKLMSPELSFDINAPEANELGKAAIAKLKEDKDHLNKQFFSLLVLNKFLPTKGAGTGAGSALWSDLAENQINAILGNISENYQIAADLGDGKTALGVQTQVGEKITITTSLGVVSGSDESAGNIVGDVVVQYRLNEDGSFTMNFFNESNQGTDAETGPFTQGVSLYYQENFNTAREFKLLQGFLNIFRNEANDVDFKEDKKNGKKKPVEGAREKLDMGQKPEDKNDYSKED